MELIKDSAKHNVRQSKKSKKKKKKDKNNNNFPTLFNSSEFQESLKVEKKEDDNKKNELND